MGPRSFLKRLWNNPLSPGRARRKRERGKTFAPRPDRQSRRWIPWFVLAVALAITVVATLYISWTTRRTDHQRFTRWVTATSSHVEDRLQRYVALLNGAASFLSPAQPISRENFKTYVDGLHISRRYPGVQGVGLSIRIASHRSADLERNMRRQGVDGFHVWPTSKDGPRHAIVYLQPMDRRNRRAIGYDMSSEPTRRAAMRRARDSGRPAASGKVTLVQEIGTHKQAGFLLYVPIYQGGGAPSAIAQRRKKLRGFVYSPFRAADLLARLVSPRSREYLDLSVYDGPSPSPQALLHRSAPDEASARAAFTPRFTRTRTIHLAGRPWTLVFTSRPAFERTLFSWLIVPITLVGGVGVSLLLFGVTLAQTTAHDQAIRRASALQLSRNALRESDERLKIALAAADMFAFTWDIRRNTIDRIGDAQRVLGIAPPSAQSVASIVHPDDRLAWERAVAGAMTDQAPIVMEFRILQTDGSAKWVRVESTVELDEHQIPRRIIGICADITRQKDIEHQLRNLNQTLEQRVADQTEESEQRSSQLRALAAELTQAEQRERRRLAQVLHDHLQQLLVAGLMTLDATGRQSGERLRASLDQVRDLLHQAITSSRSLTIELSPPVLHDAGLGPALGWLSRSMQDKHGLRVDLEVDPAAEPGDQDMKAFLFQAVRELLFNTVKHADGAAARVTLSRLDQQLCVSVADEGPGFDGDVLAVQGDRAEHFGLFSIQQRLERLGGRLEIDTARVQGACVRLFAPIAPQPTQVTPVAQVLDELPGAEAYNAADKLLETYTATSVGQTKRGGAADQQTPRTE